MYGNILNSRKKLPLIEDRGQTDRVYTLNHNPNCLPWPMTSIHRRAMVITRTQAKIRHQVTWPDALKIKVKGQAVQQLKWKQTNKRADMADFIACRANVLGNYFSQLEPEACTIDRRGDSANFTPRVHTCMSLIDRASQLAHSTDS